MKVQKEHVKSFLNFFGLDRGVSIVTYGWEDSRRERFLTGFASGICKRKQIFPLYLKIREVYQGVLPALHVTLNETKLTGSGSYRSSDNISAARVLCVDVDRKITRKKAAAIRRAGQFSMVVESSPGKFHFYLKLAPGVNLDWWSKLQLAFAWRFGGDLQRSHITATIRVPGFPRVTKEGEKFLPALVYLEEEPHCWGSKELLEEFPWVNEGIEQGEAALKEAWRQTISRARSVRADLGKKKNWSNVKGLGRNDSLYFIVSDFTAQIGCTEAEALTEAFKINEAFEKPLPQQEVRACALRGWKKGIGKYERLKFKLSVLSSSGGSGGVPGTNGHKELRPVEAAVIPKHLPGVMRALGVKVLEHTGPLEFFQLLEAAATSRDFDVLAVLLKRALLAFSGRFGPEGELALYVRGRNRWGREVFHVEHVHKDQYPGLVSTLLFEMRREVLARQGEGKGAAGGGAGSVWEQAARLAERPVRASTKRGLAEALWGLCLLEPRGERQPDGVIVFQDGVFNVDSAEFREDALAPLRYSNPVACHWGAGAVAGEADTPVFDRFLEDWFPGDSKATGELVLRWFGYCMTTDTSRQLFSFFEGPAGAGKGSLAQVLCGLVGDGNYCSLAYEALERHFALSAAAGKLVIVVEEAEGTNKQHEIRMAVVKKITGGERVQIERKYREPYEDQLPGKLLLQANKSLGYRDKGGAIAARMLPVLFKQSFRESGGASGLLRELPSRQILAAEGDALGVRAALAWARGVAELRRGKCPFRSLRESQALVAGEIEMKEVLDPVEYACKRFLRYGKGEKVAGRGQKKKLGLSRLAARQLVELCCGELGLDGGFSDRDWSQVYERVLKVFPDVQSAKVKGTRIFRWLQLNREEILRQFPGLEDSPGDYAHLGELLEELDLSKAPDALRVLS